MERVVVLVRSDVSRHHLMARLHPVPLCGVIKNRNGEGKLFNWSETKEFPEEPGEIVHLGHDDVLLLAAAVMFGANWNKGRAKWVFLIIRKWHKHLRDHRGFMIFLGALEIDHGWGVEGSRACEPNTRGWKRPDAFNNNEPHGDSGDYVQGRTGVTSARRWTKCESDTPSPAPPTSSGVRVNFILEFQW
jgi:hypothetical protein